MIARKTGLTFGRKRKLQYGIRHSIANSALNAGRYQTAATGSIQAAGRKRALRDLSMSIAPGNRTVMRTTTVISFKTIWCAIFISRMGYYSVVGPGQTH